MPTATRLLGGKSIAYAKAAGFSLIPAALWFVPVNRGHLSWSLCIYKNITGNDCYGCGITRAVLSVLHLQFSQAFGLNKSVVIVFPILVFLWARQTFRKWQKVNITALSAYPGRQQAVSSAANGG